MAGKSKKFDFEEALKSLEKMVDAMEEGDLSLEESLKAFEDGVKLTRECQATLEKAEQKVQLLIKEDELADFTDYENDEV